VDNRKKEWIVYNSSDTYCQPLLGKIHSKLGLNKASIKHWNLSSQYSNQIVPCTGCSLTTNSTQQGDADNGCNILINPRKAAVINVKKNSAGTEGRVISPLFNFNKKILVKPKRNEYKRLNLNLQPMEIDLIHKWISSEIIKKEPKDIFWDLKRINKQIYEIYTDGSLNFQASNNISDVIMDY